VGKIRKQSIVRTIISIIVAKLMIVRFTTESWIFPKMILTTMIQMNLTKITIMLIDTNQDQNRLN